MTKLNCWEVKGCGREPDGQKVRELGICPAATEGRLDGVHGGKNAGRSCWVAVGTLCGGQVQGTFAMKYSGCKLCQFYQQVQKEEWPHFRLSANLLSMVTEKIPSV